MEAQHSDFIAFLKAKRFEHLETRGALSLYGRDEHRLLFHTQNLQWALGTENIPFYIGAGALDLAIALELLPLNRVIEGTARELVDATVH